MKMRFHVNRGGRAAAIAFALLIACAGCGREKLKIIPPSPNKIARAGEGPALAFASSESSKKKSRSTAESRRNELGEKMREYDDDIAAWHRSYATKNDYLILIEAGLTERAEGEYDLLKSTAEGDNVAFAMIAVTALAFANRTESARFLLDVAGGSRDARIRENALNGLAILATRNPEVRALVQGSEIAPHLADESVGMRKAASFVAMSLVEPGNDRGLMPYLAQAATDENYMVRANAVWAVGRAGGANAVDILEVALHSDSTSEVRCNAALALAATNSSEAVEPLIDGLATEDKAVRRHCVTGLGLLTGQRLGADQDAWRSWWSTARDGFAPPALETSQSGS